MDVEHQKEPERVESPRKRAAGRDTLELCVLVVTGAVVASAFAAALTYHRVSARAPLFVMVPLLILIGLQLKRTMAVVRRETLLNDLGTVGRGRSVEFNSVLAFIGWMVVLLGLIFVAGHYVGIAAFMLTLLRGYAKESWRLSLLTTAGVTIVIYALFEHGFNIPLYRGLIFQIIENYAT